MEDDGGVLNPVGLRESDLDTWTYDNMANQIARYADPSVRFELEPKAYNGNSYVVLEVEEFSDIPVLCKRAYDNVLRDGACYVRSRRKPETLEIPTQDAMRDLLQLATEKSLRRFIAQAQRVGLIIFPTVTQPPTDQELRPWRACAEASPGRSGPMAPPREVPFSDHGSARRKGIGREISARRDAILEDLHAAYTGAPSTTQRKTSRICQRSSAIAGCAIRNEGVRNHPSPPLLD